MSEDNVLYLKKPKRFTLDEAKKLLEQVRAITHEAVEKVEPYILKIQSPELSESARTSIAEEVQTHVDDWTDRIMKLGAVPKGLWLVDFDSGAGYYCWQYNEEELGFFHGYDQSFTNRTPIQ